MDEKEILWTDYFLHRAKVRHLDLATIERIVRYSNERYWDQVSGRIVVVGRAGKQLLTIPYEEKEQTFTPITAHVTTRAQVSSRIRDGRYSIHE
ncbi:MAG: hypothetical protein KC964_10055 [Candidatus Omnitrophica bacterium]|nr:hypothetical protein [Candidatus Omnitrophota bacterium]